MSGLFLTELMSCSQKVQNCQVEGDIQSHSTGDMAVETVTSNAGNWKTNNYIQHVAPHFYTLRNN